MRLEFADNVEADLEEIAAYIAADNPRRAVSFIREIRDKISTLAEGALRYQLRPDIGPDARLTTVGQYLILFRVGDGVVYVERVVHGRRDVPMLYP